MAEYIEREAAAEAFSELLKSPYADPWRGNFNAGVADALKLARDMMLDNVSKTFSIPTADVQPVVHGKWIIKNDDFMGYPTVCSVCGRDAITSAWRPVKTPYCPNCGARLDEYERVD